MYLFEEEVCALVAFDDPAAFEAAVQADLDRRTEPVARSDGLRDELGASAVPLGR